MKDDALDLFGPAPTIDVSAMELRQRQTWDKQEVFLATYAEMGSIRKAAPAAGVDRSTERLWRRHDVLGYARRFEDAVLEFREMLEDIALDRVKHPSLNGRIGGDGALSHLLNANHPDKFRDRPKVDDDTQQKIAEALFAIAAQDRKRIAEWNKAQAKVIEGESRAIEGDEANRNSTG